ncbi:MAG: pyrE [Haloplasmataceae bacterium]|jgi:orotate phosphoribosyltransferase|nr:pyrE [Haloplasmataceae bacterium]
MERTIAKYLLEINAVTLSVENPYTWASGIKAPIYCDNRLTLSFPNIRNDIELGLAKVIEIYYPETEMLMGTATAGIAHAALVANILDLPMGYVRSSNKTHGKGNQIEGKVVEKQKVVVVEDLISTGSSSLEVVKALQEANLEVLGVISIFTYNFKLSEMNFKNANLRYHSLTNYEVLINVALEHNYITQNDFDKLKKWYVNPESTEWMK